MAIEWKVAPHGPLEQLSPRLWRVQADVPGAPLKRVMALGKRSDGTLVIHSAVALDEELMKEIDAWGKVAYLVVPNGYHRIDAPRFHERYPDAKVLAPKGSRKKVEELVKVDGTIEDYPDDPNVSFVMLRGCKDAEAVMIVKDEDGTSLVFNDALFNMPHAPGVTGFVLRHFAGSTGGPRVSNIARLLLVKDKKAYAAQLRELAATDKLRRVLVAHHEVISDDPAQVLRNVADTL
jgi:hypothetical protein